MGPSVGRKLHRQCVHALLYTWLQCYALDSDVANRGVRAELASPMEPCVHRDVRLWTRPNGLSGHRGQVILNHLPPRREIPRHERLGHRVNLLFSLDLTVETVTEPV